MTVESLTPLTGSAAGTGGFAAVGGQQFMTLLLAQLRNQNPLQPLSDTDFLAQLAQFSSLEEEQKQSAALDDLIAVSQASSSLDGLASASNLIGKEVSYLDPETGEDKTGTVDRIVFGNGQILLEIGESTVPLALITGVAGSSSGVSGGGGTPVETGPGGGGSSSGTGGGAGGTPGADPPLGSGSGNPLADALGRMLGRRSGGHPLLSVLSGRI
jgi:flagellar basal-body rod modification protein FlgD